MLGEVFQRETPSVQDHKPTPEQQNHHYQWSHNLHGRLESTRAETSREGGDSPVLWARTGGETLELPFDVLRGGLQPWAPLLQRQQ